MAQVNWAAVAHQAAVKAGHPDPEMFVRQMRQESGLRPGQTSKAGARGIAQIMPATAKGWGVDPNDPYASLDAAAKAMTKYIGSYGGDYAKALAAYNAGVGAVQKYGGVPPYKETQHYVKTILGGGAKSGSPQKPLTPGAAPARQPYGLQAAGPSAITGLLDEGSFLKGYMQRRASDPVATIQPVPAGTRRAAAPNVSTGKGVPARRPGETGQQYLDRIASSQFGLKHDPGNQQTTGGKHQGKGHYDGRATDYGDGRNSTAALNAWDDYVDKHAQELGVKFSWYGPDDDPGGGHNDHVHTETIRSAQRINKGTPR